jgi:hypothetical protein
MYLNVYVPHLQTVGAVVGYLRVHRGQRFASTTAVVPMTTKPLISFLSRSESAKMMSRRDTCGAFARFDAVVERLEFNSALGQLLAVDSTIHGYVAPVTRLRRRSVRMTRAFSWALPT